MNIVERIKQRIQEMDKAEGNRYLLNDDIEKQVHIRREAYREILEMIDREIKHEEELMTEIGAEDAIQRIKKEEYERGFKAGMKAVIVNVERLLKEIRS